MAKIEYDHILVRYGELSTKGKNRNEFIRKLNTNVRNILALYPKLTYDRTYDRLFIRLNGENADAIANDLRLCFGISSFSFAIKIISDIEEIAQTCLKLASDVNGSFKIITKRHDKLFPMVSDDINRYVASLILKNTTLKVDVHQPDHRFMIEVRKDYSFIMAKTIKGAGGYPVGIGGKALLMLSGGIDSPVAGYLTMKRGVAIEAIHFASMPYTSANALDKVLRLAQKLSKYQGFVKVHVINFTKLQMAIYQNSDESYAITIMRRMMYRIAEAVALKNNCLALASGESIGQVASQTLESIAVINEPIKLPVLRPLISFDKLEIIEVANKLATYDISIEPFEDCCTIFTPQNPVIKPTLKRALINEQKFDYQILIDECLSDIKTYKMVLSNDDELF
ncbi:MAG: tRNA uracil 4-sulfurtransferase ThiI [Erysipelotrichaceae bacterium]|nr:tRNA uracil 4-sulfurtransferase ThiI [Erysipelotrichaceae bacterium]